MATSNRNEFSRNFRIPGDFEFLLFHYMTSHMARLLSLPCGAQMTTDSVAVRFPHRVGLPSKARTFRERMQALNDMYYISL